MNSISYELHWKETKNNVNIECNLEVRVHNAKSNIILLLIPGVDGSVDGYKNKYVRIAESVQEKQNVAVVRIENPFITSFHWDSNILHILEFIDQNKQEICGNDEYELRIMAHSAGASVLATLAYKYPNITKILLVNIAMTLNTEYLIKGIEKFAGDITILMGDKDPSVDTVKQIRFSENSNTAQVVIAKNTDHDFSGGSFKIFLEAANKYLFGGRK